MTLDELLDKLEDVRPAGNGFVALCPSHDDSAQSLGITEGDDGLLLNCYAGCKTEDVIKALDLEWKDLFFHAVPNYAEPEAIYRYTDEQGNVLFEAVRFPGKKFRQRHWEGDEWVWNLDGVRRVLYRLPEVIAGVVAGRTVYVCEGEKDAEALIAAGRVATCNPMGAGKWRPEYAEFLRGANVIIVADRDEPGRNHAEAVKNSLQGIANAIYVVQAKTGKDAADHLAAGHAVEEFMPLRPRVRRGVLTARELAEQGREELNLTEHDLPGYILAEPIPLKFRKGRTYPIGGYTGDGKSRFALQGFRTLASAGVRGGYFSMEMPTRDLLNGLLTHKGIPLALLEEPWRLRSNAVMYQAFLDGLDEIESWPTDLIFDTEIAADKVADIARDREYDFIIIDHLHRFRGSSDRGRLEEQARSLTNIALEQNLMLVVLCQLRKYSRSFGGNRVDSYPIPTLQDFRETSQVADDASMSLAIWRQRDESGLRYTGTTQVIVLKNRHRTGSHDETGRFYFPHFDPVRQVFTRGEVNGLDPAQERSVGASGNAQADGLPAQPWA